ncbi:hypothetical protein [Peribacillus sp. SCS-37]|uniref:hypothetical protein n=1 Tax=Paraperibacillus esterisolvens TaxID=3115296 RepID=UPI003906B335
MEEQQVLDTSKQVAINYMKDEFGINFKVEHADFSPMGAVDVEGYDKANKKNELTVTVNAGDNYDVTGVGMTEKILPVKKSENK